MAGYQNFNVTKGIYLLFLNQWPLNFIRFQIFQQKYTLEIPDNFKKYSFKFTRPYLK